MPTPLLGRSTPAFGLLMLGVDIQFPATSFAAPQLLIIGHSFPAISSVSVSELLELIIEFAPHFDPRIVIENKQPHSIRQPAGPATYFRERTSDATASRLDVARPVRFAQAGCLESLGSVSRYAHGRNSGSRSLGMESTQRFERG